MTLLEILRDHCKKHGFTRSAIIDKKICTGSMRKSLWLVRWNGKWYILDWIVKGAQNFTNVNHPCPIESNNISLDKLYGTTTVWLSLVRCRLNFDFTESKSKLSKIKYSIFCCILCDEIPKFWNLVEADPRVLNE